MVRCQNTTKMFDKSCHNNFLHAVMSLSSNALLPSAMEEDNARNKTKILQKKTKMKVHIQTRSEELLLRRARVRCLFYNRNDVMLHVK